VEITADVADNRFVELNDAQVVAHVTAPSGRQFDVPMEWTGERSGQYRATFPGAEAGWYEARVAASREGKDIGSSVTHLRAAPDDAEYFDAAMRASLLRRIAQDTGGRFYTEGDASALPEDLKLSGRGVTAVEERDLWHMPILLMLFVALVCTEWGLRRAWRLA
jgi:hypothetical protein